MAARVIVLKEHRVKTGETLASVAADHGMSWQELADFNWETSDPAKVNEKLHTIVGCIKKTADGRNYIFDDNDDPGILFIPEVFKRSGLSVQQVHTIHVNTFRHLIIRLEDTAGHRIPATPYQIVFEDETKIEGTLGNGGAALIRNPPQCAFAVIYPDHADIQAKSLAATAHDAIEAADVDAIARVLQHPSPVLHGAVSAYSSWWNDLSGEGMVTDIYDAVTDEKALAVMEGWLAYQGLPVRGNVIVARTQELDGY
jgi:hypothetical protein